MAIGCVTVRISTVLLTGEKKKSAAASWKCNLLADIRDESVVLLVTLRRMMLLAAEEGSESDIRMKLGR